MSRSPSLAAALVALLAVPAAAPAEAQELFDRGVFVITRAGAEVGREEFALRAATGRGAAGLLAVSTTRVNGREIQRALEVTREYVPVSFQQTETSGGRVVSRVTAQLSGIRVSARIASQDGETAREFPVRPPVIILSDDGYSAYYFVPRPDSGQERRVAVVDPGAARSESGTVDLIGPDSVTVAQQRVAARHFRLRIGSDERHFWFTASGDLLQVSQPARNVIATRAEAPRH
jgi:hypothetical protein